LSPTQQVSFCANRKNRVDPFSYKRLRLAVELICFKEDAMALDLNKDVFQMVLARIRQRADSLRSIWRFDHVGMEG
jgi:hypothetical protein